MGEGNNLQNCQLFFCKAEDLGTEREEWKEVKHVDSICLREKTTIPELGVEEPWPNSWSFSATLENPEGILEISRKIREHQNRRFHYIQQIMPRETKDYFRKLSIALKVKKLKKK